MSAARPNQLILTANFGSRILCTSWAGDIQTMCYSWLQGKGTLRKIQTINGGKHSEGNSGYANEENDNRGSNRLSPRGEGGEGRVRNWRCIQHFRFSFVHVFNGYVASLSIYLTKTKRPLRSVHETVHKQQSAPNRCVFRNYGYRNFRQRFRPVCRSGSSS